jgi:hypothetical protein
VEDAGAVGVGEGLEGDLGGDASAGDVDLEGARGEGRGGDGFVALHLGDAAGGAEGVAEGAGADDADSTATTPSLAKASTAIVTIYTWSLLYGTLRDHPVRSLPLRGTRHQ